MVPRNLDAPTTDDLSYLCSRQHEDYLDWLENQQRPSHDYFKSFRRLAGAVAGAGALVWAMFFG